METFNTIGGCPALDEYARDLENKKIEILKLKEQNPLCPEENYLGLFTFQSNYGGWKSEGWEAC